MTPAKYFQENPSAKDGVMKAFFAYHAESDFPRAHIFGSDSRESTCRYCGRSRELVRNDDLAPECQSRPEAPNIAGIIHNEEHKAFQLLQKAGTEVPRLIANHGMSGETLAILHHTHGFDAETVDAIIPVPRSIMESYHSKMEEERERSRKAFKPKVISA